MLTMVLCMWQQHDMQASHRWFPPKALGPPPNPGNIYVAGKTFGAMEATHQGLGVELQAQGHHFRLSLRLAKICSHSDRCRILLILSPDLRAGDGSADVFVMKVNEKGSRLWTKQAGSAAEDQLYQMELVSSHVPLAKPALNPKVLDQQHVLLYPPPQTPNPKLGVSTRSP